MTQRINVCSCVIKEWLIHDINIHKKTITIHYFDTVDHEYKVAVYSLKEK